MFYRLSYRGHGNVCLFSIHLYSILGRFRDLGSGRDDADRLHAIHPVLGGIGHQRPHRHRHARSELVLFPWIDVLLKESKESTA